MPVSTLQILAHFILMTNLWFQKVTLARAWNLEGSGMEEGCSVRLLLLINACLLPWETRGFFVYGFTDVQEGRPGIGSEVSLTYSSLQS